MVHPDGPLMKFKAQRMHFGSWITKAADTHSELIIIIINAFHGNNGYANALQFYITRLLYKCFLSVSIYFIARHT